MANVLALTATWNQDFQLTLNMSAWAAAGYDLGVASHIRLAAALDYGKPVVLRFSNQPSEQLTGVTGAIDLQGTSLVLRAPCALISSIIRQLALNAGGTLVLVYDARIRTAQNRIVTMFGGQLTFDPGVSGDDH